MALKFEKQPSKFVKPLVPTPSNLKHYKIGFVDELAPFMDVAIVLFFNNNHDPEFVVQLERSLEKTLTRLYPLAGRYVEESQTVDCNDEGVEFIQAKVNIKLEDIVGVEVNVRLVYELIPLTNKPHSIVLKVQLTTFECGGVALGVSATHKVVDASTLCTFLNEWASTNREENDIIHTWPSFISSSLFPSRGLISPPLVPYVNDDDLLSIYTRKKLSFSESAICDMRAKSITSERLSKVQLVSAIIWKALMRVDCETHGYLRESVLLQPINLRGKMASSIPKYSCGNLWGVCSTFFKPNEELTNLLNDSINKTINEYSKIHHDSEQGQMMVLNSFLNMTNIPVSTNVIQLTSWCKFPFYEVDFGLGKPILAVPWVTPSRNSVLLTDDAKGNGVEAYIFLEVKDVSSFEDCLDVNVFNT